jgi:hypothetical protein
MPGSFGGVIPRAVEGYATEQSCRDGSVQRENCGFIAPGQSAFTIAGIYAIGAGNSLTTPLAQVPVGKVLLITDIYLWYDTAVQQHVKLTAGTASGSALPIFASVPKGDTAPIELPGIETQPAVLPGQTLWFVIDTCTAATNVYLTISGIEQNFGIG